MWVYVYEYARESWSGGVGGGRMGGDTSQPGPRAKHNDPQSWHGTGWLSVCMCGWVGGWMGGGMCMLAFQGRMLPPSPQQQHGEGMDFAETQEGSDTGREGGRDGGRERRKVGGPTGDINE